MLKAAVVEATARHTATLIFLHGLGDTGHGWASALASSLPISGLRIVCPHAPSRPVTVSGGASMPAWYDIASLGGPTPEASGPAGRSRSEDEDGLEASRKAVLEIVRREHVERGIPLERIVLGGFSQGAAVSLYTLLRSVFGREEDSVVDAACLGGIVALSGYVPCHAALSRHAKSGSTPRLPPVFVAHGTADAVVNMRWHVLSAAWLREMLPPHASLDVRTYENLGHTSSAKEMADVLAFVRSVLSDSESDL